ncbi:putative aspartic-type endopeptidase [Stachybotrys elegans]|uniref:Aspartic-type endopeptidase n=1 Tax=Stachybotrys elegans TaxID=80388 RepID=A0A8K0WR72_9HYPO|nr:putative aspartic-type endopeptidase [Stachybotrys elegans]
MRSQVLLAQLALFVSSTHAFYPYMPEWCKEEHRERRSVEDRDSRGVTLNLKQRQPKTTTPHPDHAARTAGRLSAKYGRLQRSSSPNTSLSKRNNQYNVLEASDPGRPMAAGLHQDGHDMSYFVQVQIGSQNQEYYMLVDTGAGSSWIMSDECTSRACELHDTFGPDKSDSLEESDDDFEIVYGTGEVNGTLVKDRFTIAGISLDFQFGLAHGTSSDFTDFVFDGILGFSMDKGVNQNFVSALRESNQLESNVFSIALHRSADGDNVGEIALGTINHDRHTGDISYNDIMEGNEWTIRLEDMKFNGKGAGVGGVRSYIDSGTSYAFGPQRLVEQLHRTIPGANSTDGRTWTVPCDTEDELAFTFSGVDYKISTRDWVSPRNSNGVCTSNIYGFEVVSGAWLLGDTFLKNVYAVFDMDKRRIGFAPLAVSESSSGSVSSANGEPTGTSTGVHHSETGSSHSAGTTPVPNSSASSTRLPGRTGRETETSTGSIAPEVTEDADQNAPEGSASGLQGQSLASTLLSAVAMVALLI